MQSFAVRGVLLLLFLTLLIGLKWFYDVETFSAVQQTWTPPRSLLREDTETTANFQKSSGVKEQDEGIGLQNLQQQAGEVPRGLPLEDTETTAHVQKSLGVQERDDGIRRHNLQHKSGIQQREAVRTVTHVAFHKGHRVGGTTMLHILARFGLRRNLTFVLPIITTNPVRRRLNTVDEHKLNFWPISEGHHFDIVTSHAIFDHEAYSDVLPADTVYIGIVRETVSHFLSLVYIVFSEAHLITLMEDVRNYSTDSLRYHKRKRQQNGMAIDLGFTEMHLHDDHKFDEYLMSLNKTFKLVMVTGRYDESLVLLKRYLNWNTKDIAYVRKNENETPRNYILSENDEEIIRNLNFMDNKIYNFFAKRFEREIAQQGSDFEEEVSFFRSVLRQVPDFCALAGTGNETTKLEIGASRWSDAFEITAADCALLEINGGNLHTLLIDRHTAMFPVNNRNN